MKISEMIEVLEAARRKEKTEFRYKHADSNSIWVTNHACEFDFAHYTYRIAPKKEMTLVEELREYESQVCDGNLFRRAADRIEKLEAMQKSPAHLYTTDELLAEIKRRTSC